MNSTNQILVRFEQPRSQNGGKTIKVALVSEIKDSYETILEPTGCITPLKGVPVDINHNRVPTECQMIDLGIETIKVPTGNQRDGQPETKEINARIVEIFVPENAKIWTKENRNLAPNQIQSLFDDIKNYPNNRFRWASVDFEPIEIVQYKDKNGKLYLEVYPKWKLNYFSLLNVKPGQDTSFFLNVRSDKNSITTTNLMSNYKKGDELSRKSKCRIMSDCAEKEGKRVYSVILDDEDNEQEMDEDNLERMFGKKPKEEIKTDKKPVEKNKEREDEREDERNNDKIRSFETKLDNLQIIVEKLTEDKTTNIRSFDDQIKQKDKEIYLLKSKLESQDLITKGDSENLNPANRRSFDESEGVKNKEDQESERSELLKKYSTAN